MTKKVFVNGTFDLLHKGHLELLNYAKSMGDILYVAIDTDQRVKEKKGESRPINSQNDRAEFLTNLKSVDYVVLFGTDDELEYLVKSIEPDIMVVGSDWIGKTVIGSEHAKELKFFNRLDGYSTTNTIERIINRGEV
jgi:rfaE bifunctional protein nucleotidyltransferase chain/domain